MYLFRQFRIAEYFTSHTVKIQVLSKNILRHHTLNLFNKKINIQPDFSGNLAFGYVDILFFHAQSKRIKTWDKYK